MAFSYKKSLRGNSTPVLQTVIIDNSDDIEVGDMVKCYNAGNAEKATAGVPIFGVVHAIVDKYGNAIEPEKQSKAVMGSATEASGVVTVASDNETVDKISVVVDTSVDSIYSGTVDGTIGTTNSSEKLGAYMNLTDENSIAENSAVRNGQAQLYGWGTDPDDSTKLLVSIVESELHAGMAFS